MFALEEVAQTGDPYWILVPVELDFDIHKDREKFRLEGTARTELELSCSRCLEPFRMPVDASFDLRYLPASEMVSDGERETQDEDLDIGYYRDDQIDLNELLREQFYLALPMKPLCQEDCRGLCPQCGTNLNTSTCACEPDVVDPRLAALKSLRSKDA